MAGPMMKPRPKAAPDDAETAGAVLGIGNVRDVSPGQGSVYRPAGPSTMRLAKNQKQGFGKAKHQKGNYRADDRHDQQRTAAIAVRKPGQ